MKRKIKNIPFSALEKKIKKSKNIFKKLLHSGNVYGMITNCMRLFTEAPSQAEVML